MSKAFSDLYRSEISVTDMLALDLLNKLTQGFCVFDGEHRLVCSNVRYAEIYGISASALRPGMTLSEIVDLRFVAGSGPVIQRESYMQWREQIADKGSATETIIRLCNGKTIEIQHQPLPDGGWVSTHHDISKRLETEACLREQTTILQAILTSTPNAILLVDARGTVQAFSERAVDLLGIDRSQLVLKPSFRSLTSITEASTRVDDMDRWSATADDQGVGRSGDVIRVGGRTLSMRQDTGPSGSTLITYTDVTDHCGKVETLRRENEQLRSILDQTRTDARPDRDREGSEDRAKAGEQSFHPASFHRPHGRSPSDRSNPDVRDLMLRRQT